MDGAVMPLPPQDPWAPLSHKTGFDVEEVNAPAVTIPAWVGDHKRRLAAYALLRAYLTNTSRYFLRETDEDEQLTHREYGDAGVITERIVAGVLGDDMQISVSGADDDLPVRPELPPRPQEPAGEALPAETDVYNAQVEVYEAAVADEIERWKQKWLEHPKRQKLQDWLRSWGDRVNLFAKIYESEVSHGVPLGDGVMLVTWSGVKQDVAVTVFEPDVYFPTLPLNPVDPVRKAHLAWEFTEGEGEEAVDYIRRITFELGPPGYEGNVGQDLDDPDIAGSLQTYPWTDEVQNPPSLYTCYMTDLRIETESLGELTLENMQDGPVEYMKNEEGIDLKRVDMQIDELPLVHCPNTPSTVHHYGTSSLTRVLQVFDDLAASDTDAQLAGALAGSPMVALSGASVPGGVLTVTPGAIHQLGERGRMYTLDLGHSLTAVRSLVDDLLDRLSINSQVPKGLLGRIDPSEVPSGITLTLSFSPFDHLVNVLRLTRHNSHEQVLGVALKLAMANGHPEIDAGPIPHTRVVYGSHMPADLSGTVDMVVQLLSNHGISRRTALLMLMEAGLDLSNLTDEIMHIQSEDGGTAVDYTNATDNPEAGTQYLGLSASVAGTGDEAEGDQEPNTNPFQL
jgi:hypothetical protein